MHIHIRFFFVILFGLIGRLWSSTTYAVTVLLTFDLLEGPITGNVAYLRKMLMEKRSWTLELVSFCQLLFGKRITSPLKQWSMSKYIKLTCLLSKIRYWI